MTTPAEDVFDFWEAAFSNDDAGAAAPPVDALALAYELQPSEWTEQGAALELARRCTVAGLRSARSQLVAMLQGSPIVLPRAICACRAVWIALEIATANERD